MTTIRTRLIASAAGMVMLTAGAVYASAAPRSAAPATPAALTRGYDLNQLPSGLLEASGSGVVRLTGRLAVSANLPRRGVVRVWDRAGDGQLYVAGRRIALSRRPATVRRATGIVFASGSNLVLQVSATDVEMSAAGAARVQLRGSGLYRLNLGAERAWRRGSLVLAPESRAGKPGRGKRSANR